MKRKLNLFGHICRMDDGRMVKTVVFGMMEGTNRKGRPRREWLDDITEWCKKGIQEVAGIAKDRETWKHLAEDVYWTPTGNALMDHNDDDDEVFGFSLQA